MKRAGIKIRIDNLMQGIRWEDGPGPCIYGYLPEETEYNYFIDCDYPNRRWNLFGDLGVSRVQNSRNMY
jgi:hypothetical protein